MTTSSIFKRYCFEVKKNWPFSLEQSICSHVIVSPYDDVLIETTGSAANMHTKCIHVHTLITQKSVNHGKKLHSTGSFKNALIVLVTKLLTREKHDD